MNISDFSALTFTFFEASIDEIESFLKKIKSEDLEPQKITLSKMNFDIHKYFSEVPDLKNPQKPSKQTVHPTLEAFFYNPSCCPEKTMMISNSRDGWIQLCRIIAKNFRCRFYRFAIDEEFGNSFESRDGVSTRVVYALKEDRWIFYETGEMLSIENKEYYKKRNKKDRINKKILIEYCTELNLDVFNDSFWCSEDEGLLYVRKNSI